MFAIRSVFGRNVFSNFSANFRTQTKGRAYNRIEQSSRIKSNCQSIKSECEGQGLNEQKRVLWHQRGMNVGVSQDDVTGCRAQDLVELVGWERACHTARHASITRYKQQVT